MQINEWKVTCPVYKYRNILFITTYYKGIMEGMDVLIRAEEWKKSLDVIRVNIYAYAPTKFNILTFKMIFDFLWLPKS